MLAGDTLRGGIGGGTDAKLDAISFGLALSASSGCNGVRRKQTFNWGKKINFLGLEINFN